MTDPTPTRADWETLVAHNKALIDRNVALRERAEAAERVIKAQDYDYGRAISERDAARRAESAAWNDAIEAAAWASGDSAGRAGLEIRALRRATPTEGEA